MKKVVLISLVVIVIGIGFYIGYQKANQGSDPVSPEIASRAYTQLFSDLQQQSNNMNKDKLMKFVKSYSLLPNENLKFIPSPLPEAREVYNQLSGSDINEPIITYWRWTKAGTFRKRGMSYDKTNLSAILTMVTDLEPYEIEIAERYRTKDIQGDIVYREDATPEDILTSLENICHRDLQLPIKISFEMVPRNAWVVRGSYNFNPILNQENIIELYEQKVGFKRGDRGTGDLKTFLKWVEKFYARQWIIDEVENPPQEKLKWHNNEPRNKTKNAELVFKHLTEQTGLVFTREIRPVRVLVVE
jgi:hypothetical protein